MQRLRTLHIIVPLRIPYYVRQGILCLPSSFDQFKRTFPMWKNSLKAVSIRFCLRLVISFDFAAILATISGKHHNKNNIHTQAHTCEDCVCCANCMAHIVKSKRIQLQLLAQGEPGRATIYRVFLCQAGSQGRREDGRQTGRSLARTKLPLQLV